MRRQKLKQKLPPNTTTKKIDPITWIESNIKIEDPQSKVSVFKFKLWPEQKDALKTIEEKDKIVILKSRQLGISWLVQAFALYLAINTPSTNILVLSSTLKAAKEVVRRFKFMFDNMTNPVVGRGEYWNTSMVSFTNGSRINAFAPTASAGASFTASFVIMDEFALMPNAEVVYNSVKPTIDDGGKIVIISTARAKTGKLFENIFKNAYEKKNEYTSIFLPWWVRPTRTKDWYDQNLFDSEDKALFRQEYPENIEDAFGNVGEDRFVSEEDWDDCADVTLVGEETEGRSAITYCEYYEWVSKSLNSRTKVAWSIDGSVKRDLTCILGITYEENVYKVVYVFAYKPTPAAETDFTELKDKIVSLWRQYNSQLAVYDAYQLADLGQRALREGIPLSPFPQNAKRWESDTLLRSLIQSRLLKHPNIDILNENVMNAHASIDEATGRVKLDKFNRNLKIDLAVALSMGCFAISNNPFKFEKPKPIVIPSSYSHNFTRQNKIEIKAGVGLIFGQG